MEMLKHQIEQEAYLLAVEFINTFRSKYGFGITHPDKVKTSKWWGHFLKTIELYGQRPEWNRKEYVKILFRENGKIYPYYLPSNNAWTIYTDNYIEKKDEDEYKIILLSIIAEYKRAKKYFNEDGLIDINTIKRLSSNIQRDMVSKYFLCILKPFYELNKERAFYDERNMKIKKALIFNNKKVLDKLKEVFKESLAI